MQAKRLVEKLVNQYPLEDSENTERKQEQRNNRKQELQQNARKRAALKNQIVKEVLERSFVGDKGQPCAKCFTESASPAEEAATMAHGCYNLNPVYHHFYDWDICKHHVMPWIITMASCGARSQFPNQPAVLQLRDRCAIWLLRPGFSDARRYHQCSRGARYFGMCAQHSMTDAGLHIAQVRVLLLYESPPTPSNDVNKLIASYFADGESLFFNNPNHAWP
jgi:hypothetical protein